MVRHLPPQTPESTRALAGDLAELVSLAAELVADHERHCRASFAIAGLNEKKAARARHGDERGWLWFANPTMMQMAALLRRLQDTPAVRGDG